MTLPFGRIITAMITPFKEDGEINYDKAAELADFLSENGSDAIVLGGTTGESPTLSDDEKLNLFSRIKKTIGGKIKIIAGTGSNSTEHSIFLTKEAEKCGVDGIMLVVPYYNKPSQEGLYRHFAAIAESTELPVMLYNIPGRSAVNMTAETTLRLAQIPNIRAVKEASGNLEQIAAICSGAPEGFAVYSGDDSMTLPIMSIGGSGVVSVASHIAGREIKQMVLEFQSGNYREALRIHHRLLPLFKVLFITSNPSPVKGALKLLGNDAGPLRLPLVELTADEQATVRKVLQNLNYL